MASLPDAEPPAASHQMAHTAPGRALSLAPSKSFPISPAVAAGLACAVCAAGSALAAVNIGEATEGPLFNTIGFGGPLAAMLIVAVALVVSGYLNLWRAAILVVAGYVGFFVAIYCAYFLTLAAPSFGTEGADIAGGFTMGALGALTVLVTLVMLTRDPDLGRLIPIALSGVLLVGVATALAMVVPGMSLRNGNYIVWAAVAWYAALGASLVWMLAAPRPG